MTNYKATCKKAICFALENSSNLEETAYKLGKFYGIENIEFKGLDDKRNFGQPEDYARIILEKIAEPKIPKQEQVPKKEQNPQPETLEIIVKEKEIETKLQPSTPKVLWEVLKTSCKNIVKYIPYGIIGALPQVAQKYISKHLYNSSVSAEKFTDASIGFEATTALCLTTSAGYLLTTNYDNYRIAAINMGFLGILGIAGFAARLLVNRNYDNHKTPVGSIIPSAISYAIALPIIATVTLIGGAISLIYQGGCLAHESITSTYQNTQTKLLKENNSNKHQGGD